MFGQLILDALPKGLSRDLKPRKNTARPSAAT
jgi:hypothetical protein